MVIYHPTLDFFHGNARGTGSMLRISVEPSKSGGLRGGVYLSIAPQLTIGDHSCAQPVYPTFDYQARLCVKIDFTEVCQFLQVLCGETETINDGRGLVHRFQNSFRTIKLSHVLEPISGYRIEIYSRSSLSASSEDRWQSFYLSSSEALGVYECFRAVLPFIAFGMPSDWGTNENNTNKED